MPQTIKDLTLSGVVSDLQIFAEAASKLFPSVFGGVVPDIQIFAKAAGKLFPSVFGGVFG